METVEQNDKKHDSDQKLYFKQYWIDHKDDISEKRKQFRISNKEKKIQLMIDTMNDENNTFKYNCQTLKRNNIVYDKEISKYKLISN